MRTDRSRPPVSHQIAVHTTAGGEPQPGDDRDRDRDRGDVATTTLARSSGDGHRSATAGMGAVGSPQPRGTGGPGRAWSCFPVRVRYVLIWTVPARMEPPRHVWRQASTAMRATVRSA
jgi:hypothetical protein